MTVVLCDRRVGWVAKSLTGGGRPFTATFTYYADERVGLDIFDSTYAGMTDGEIYKTLEGRYVEDAYKEPYPLDGHVREKGQLMFKGVMLEELRYHQSAGLIHPTHRGWTLLHDAITELIDEAEAFREYAASRLRPTLGAPSLADTLFG